MNPVFYSLSGGASVSSRLLPFVCVKWRVFSNSLCSIVVVTLKELLVITNKLNYTHTKVGAKVQPHQPSLLIVFPTKMLKYLRFLSDIGVCVKNKDSTS